MIGLRLVVTIEIVLVVMVCSAGASERDVLTLREAIVDLIETFDERYPQGPDYLLRLEAWERSDAPQDAGVFERLKREALLANPLLDFERLVLLKRKRGQLGLPTNHQCNACLERTGYENEIALLRSVRLGGKMQTLYRPKQGAYVGEIDLDFDAQRLLFTMPDAKGWAIHELTLDDHALRRITPRIEDVDHFDGCYLPDGRIVFASTASITGVPCWHGKERACSLYRIDANGTGMRQLCFDQDLDLHPAVLPNGQVIYSRWDYTGIMHVYLRLLMVMNPDGTSQRAVYGTNSYYPNALYYPRAVPGSSNRLVAILSGYHGVHRMGELVLLDTTVGWREADGIVQRIMHRNEPAVPVIRDRLVDDSWPKFLHPYPLSENYFLTAAQPNAKSPWGIYLVDRFDNMVPICVDRRFDFFEPIPLRPTPKPPEVPSRVDPTRDDAVVYLHDVYAGPGLAGVPRGAVKRLRIVAYEFGYPGMAGPDKIGRAGPWDAMRILGTVPVDEDGSVAFRIPASVPLSIQPLDAEGKALQWMRSWYTAMPGETASCVGCHERPSDVPRHRFQASVQRPHEIEPWHGPARGFDFEREVQPVLDRYCVGCHDGSSRPDLRAERFATNYQGLPLTNLGAKRMLPELRARFASHVPEHALLGNVKMRYTPAYDALIPFIRRVNIEDYVGLHVPGEYHADTSELVQMLQKGHFGVTLDDQARDRLVTWIDLNGPCHGTWGDVGPIPHRADRRRRELARRFGGPTLDPEVVHDFSRRPIEPLIPSNPSRPNVEMPRIDDWPFDKVEAQRRQRSVGHWRKHLDLGDGVTLGMVRIPPGRFCMGSAEGMDDEFPPHTVEIERPFWVSTHEITNAQYARFDPTHDSGLFMKRSISPDGPGIAMNGPRQPVVRVSWQRAVDFGRWLSKKTGITCRLPTESEWEYAARAGTSTAWNFGPPGNDFSAHANLADRSLSRLLTGTGGVVVLQEIPSDMRFDDCSVVTSDVGSYATNAWGLFDMHGNASEWTRSAYRSYPYRDDRRNAMTLDGRKVVRGGSFHDRPKRARSTFRLGYPAWQRVHDVGFRIVCEM